MHKHTQTAAVLLALLGAMERFYESHNCFNSFSLIMSCIFCVHFQLWPYLEFLPFTGVLGKARAGHTQQRWSHSWLFLILLGSTWFILCGMKVEEENREEQGEEEREAQWGIRNRKRKKESNNTHLIDQRCDRKHEKGFLLIPDIPPMQRGDKVEEG